MSGRDVGGDRLREMQRGLRMSHPPDPGALAAEKRDLTELEKASPLRRTRAYLKLSGPGYMQSAMTLGGGTAIASLGAGAAFGYKLLWVAPTAMLLGIVMLTAVSHQTLSTGMRPFDAMARFAGKPLAWAWAIGALLSSIIWHFPQYSLASAGLVDIGAAFGQTWQPQYMSFVILAWAIGLSTLYGKSPTWVRLYERLLKYMVWGIVLCFGYVVFKTGVDWSRVAEGLTFQVPDSREGVAAVTLILSGLSAAVGVNMLFLYPYSLLARGWGREHRRLARFDLYVGMLIPYVLATGLILIASANTLYDDFAGDSIAAVDAAQSLATVIGPRLGRSIFDLGLIGMALSSISLQMLTCGFVATELFGWEVGSRKHQLTMLIPTPGVLGPVLWTKLVWLAVPTNIVCGLFLPAAYLGFTLLQRNEHYMGSDLVRGPRGRIWFLAMLGITVFMVVFLGWYMMQYGPGYFDTYLTSTGG